MKHYKGDLTDFIIETVDKNNINAAMIKKNAFLFLIHIISMQ